MNPTRICNVANCDKPTTARGWCPTHYARWRRNGHVEATRDFHSGCSVQGCPNPHHAKGLCNSHYSVATYKPHPIERQPITDRFWSKVAKGAPDDCWIWKGSYFDDGYGAFSTRGERITSQRAHRYSLRLKLGREIAPGMLACHTCDTPACVNPAHLYEGSPLQNQRDCALRDRNHYGERVERPRRKLTEAQVVEMRHLRAAGATQRALAARYGVGSATVARITKGSAWARSAGPRTPPPPGR